MSKDSEKLFLKVESQPMSETADDVKASRNFVGSRVQLALFIALLPYWIKERVAGEHTPAVIANRWLVICSAFIVLHLRDSFDWPPRARQALKILHWIVVLILVVYFVRTGW